MCQRLSTKCISHEICHIYLSPTIPSIIKLYTEYDAQLQYLLDLHYFIVDYFLYVLDKQLLDLKQAINQESTEHLSMIEAIDSELKQIDDKHFLKIVSFIVSAIRNVKPNGIMIQIAWKSLRTFKWMVFNH
eukprot:NODE_887_length_3307_cov_0.181733.p3 type:complete len:131 gc:universal NODE_887_length_3307_cov_0.181733:733-341(-)